MNMEPTDKKSPEWREWKVKNIFGGLTVAAIKSSRTKLEHLAVLHRFIDDIIDNRVEEICDKALNEVINDEPIV